MRAILKQHSRLIIGVIIGFVSCFIIAAIVAYADELPEEPGYAYEDEAGEYAAEDVLDAEPDEPDLEALPEELPPKIKSPAPTPQPAPVFTPIQPMASGAIVAELMDLMNPPLENAGFTVESWERYEDAMAAAWNVVFNFMDYTDLEVLVVIIQLRTAIEGLQYIPGMEPPGEVDLLAEFPAFIALNFGIFAGSLAGSVFMGKWDVGV